MHVNPKLFNETKLSGLPLPLNNPPPSYHIECAVVFIREVQFDKFGQKVGCAILQEADMILLTEFHDFKFDNQRCGR